jgi:hypothetical protein
MNRIDTAVGVSVAIAGLVFLGVLLQTNLFDRIATGFRPNDELRVETAVKQLKNLTKAMLEDLETAQVMAGDLKNHIQEDDNLHKELRLRSTQAVENLEASVMDRLDILEKGLTAAEKTQAKLHDPLIEIVAKFEEIQYDISSIKNDCRTRLMDRLAIDGTKKIIQINPLFRESFTQNLTVEPPNLSEALWIQGITASIMIVLVFICFADTEHIRSSKKIFSTGVVFEFIVK